MSRKIIVAGLAAALIGLLLAQGGPAQAAVSGVSPSSAPAGAQSKQLTISGSGFVAGAPTTVTFSPAAGISVKSATAQTSSTVLAVVDIAADAVPGFKDVSVSQTGINHGTCDDCFSIGPFIAGSSGPHPNDAASTVVTLTGEGFVPGAAATLSRTGYGHANNESDSMVAAAVNVAPGGTSAQLTFSGASTLLGRAPGFWKVTLTNPDNGAGTYGNGTSTGVEITGGAPTVTSIAPAEIGAGAQGRTLTVRGSNLARGVTLAFAPTGGASGSVSQTGPAVLAGLDRADVPVNVAAGSSGAFSVTARNADGKSVTCSGCLTVNPAPAPTAIAPSSLGQGAGPVAVEVTGQSFRSGATLSFSGTGVSVTGPPTVTATKITATVTVAENAALTDRDVIVTNPDGGRGSSAGALEIVGGPKVTGVSPGARPQGSTTEITVNGSNFPADLNASEVDFGPGVTVTAVRNMTLLRDRFAVTAAVAASAAPGDRDVVVRNDTNQGVTVAKGTCAKCFTVAGKPVLSSISPNVIGQAATDIVAVLQGGHFQSGATVNLGGDGVTTGTVNRVSDTRLEVPVSVTTGATVGPRDVRITNPDGGTVLCSACLQVTARPTISKVTPASRPQGFAGTIRIDGTGFDSGITPAHVRFVGGKITVSEVTVESPTKLVASVAVAADASTAARNVVVTNPDHGTYSCTDCFQVSLAPVIAAVSPASSSTNGVETVVLSGDHFQPGAQFRLQSAHGVIEATDEANLADAGGKNRLSGKVDLTGVSPGPWSVRILNPDSGTHTLTEGFTVSVPRPDITSISPTSVPQLSTNVTVRVSGQHFRPGLAVDIPDGRGVTLKSFTIVGNGGNRIDLVLDVSGIARLGTRDINVTNTDGKIGRCISCLTVADGDQPHVMANHNLYGPFEGGAFGAAGDFDGNPDNGDEIVTGAGFGGGPHVQLWRVNRSTGTLTPLIGAMVYPVGFPGGVRVAAGNFDGNLSNGLEFVTSAGPTGGPHVRVLGYDPSTNSFTEPYGAGFFAYDPAFSGGVFVSATDVDGDGIDEIVIGAGAGGGPHVRVWKLNRTNGTFAPIRDWMAYDHRFTGGVTVGAGDLVPEGAGCGNNRFGEIVTGPGRGGGPHVKVFCADGRLAHELMAGPASGSGANVGAADVNGDTIDELVVGDGSGPVVRVYDTERFLQIREETVYEPSFRGGVQVSGHDVDGDGDDEVVTVPGNGRTALLTIRRYQ